MVPKQNGGDSAPQRQSEGGTSPTRMERQAAGPEWDWMSGAFAMPCLESGKLEDIPATARILCPVVGAPQKQLDAQTPELSPAPLCRMCAQT